ncbi:zinc finger protein 670-like isoform X2 [Lucilia cuprina]|uniref:zinc finger protein 670-like isoform X2 n=1 Tax=Lucilia cuprina TaxID=7375 RepID=UPI001F0621DC|nr:zinc finger protein 670-like isoform X2 [Lucilia cuprina]
MHYQLHCIQYFDELPHLICCKCVNLVLSAYKLKERCEKSQRTLITLLDNPLKGICLNKNTQEKGSQTQLLAENMPSISSINCRYCLRSFQSIEDLKTHLNVFHPESDCKNFNECHICKRQFTRAAHLIRHIQSKHKFFKVEIKSLNEQEVSAISLEEETNITEKVTNESIQECEILKLIKVDDVGHLTDDESEIPLKLLLESLNTSEITEDSQNSIEIEETNIAEDDTPPVKRNRGRITKQSKTEDVSDNILQENEYDSIEILKETKRGPGRPSKNALNCKYCSEYCKTAKILQQHIAENHITTLNFSCKICNENFSAKKDLIYHLSNYHQKTRRLTSFMSKKKNMQNLFYCTKCDKNFSTKNSLQRHQENHDKKRYVCKECLQDFPNKEELNAHTKAEGHDKPLLCPECGLRCKSSNILTVHLRRHNGEKPFKCKFCSKGFPRMDDLKIHEKYHTGEKSHFCETCGKGFFRKYNLRIHLRVHTGEKPHKCPHCPQAFAQSNDLKAHIRRHTGERFRCEVCNAGFLQGYQIRQHKLQEHGIHEIPPTQRLQKFTSAQEQEKQIKQNLQTALD